MNDRKQCGVPDLARALRRPYLQVYNAIVSGVIPAERDESGRHWLIHLKDLQMIADIMGVVLADTSDEKEGV